MLIYEVLQEDHRILKETLNQLVNLEDDSPDRDDVIHRVGELLIPHARAEEYVLYNSLRQLKTVKSEVMHSYREHMEAETTFRTLQLKEKIDADWKSTALKLKDALEHHIEEEEGKLFDLARRYITTEEATSMADAFEKLKAEMRDEGMFRSTLDMVKNLMPARFKRPFRSGETGFRL